MCDFMCFVIYFELCCNHSRVGTNIARPSRVGTNISRPWVVFTAGTKNMFIKCFFVLTV